MSTFEDQPAGSTGAPETQDVEEAIRAIAIARGKTPEEVLHEADRHITKELSRPRDGCLRPDDLVDYQSGRPLPVELEAHVAKCSYCARLLRSVKPDPMRMREFEQARAAAANRYRREQRAVRGWWADWRAIASVAAAATIVVVVSLQNRNGALLIATQPLPAHTAPSAVAALAPFLITATPTSDPNAASVSIRVTPGSSLPARITASTVAANQGLQVAPLTQKSLATLAASTAAVAKHPPEIHVPPYGGSADKLPDVQQEATEKTVAFVANMLKVSGGKAPEEFDLKEVTDAANAQGLTNPVWNGSDGTLKLYYNAQNAKFATELQYMTTMRTAALYEQDLKVELAKRKLKPGMLKLNSGIDLELHAPAAAAKR
jgi:hypothetical protein